MTDTYWAEREGARWDVYGKQRGWMAQADTEDDARLIVAALTAQQAPPAALAVDGMAEITRAWNAGYKAARIELGVALVAERQAQQPAAAVPNRLPDIDPTEDQRAADYHNGWNDCRASMLAAADKENTND